MMKHRQLLIFVILSLIISASSSFITYRILEKKIPKVATLDIAYLNNEFIMNLSQELSDNKMEDEEVRQIVDAYLKHLEILISDIDRENYIVFQRQNVVSKVKDVTQEVKDALVESITFETQYSGGQDDK